MLTANPFALLGDGMAAAFSESGDREPPRIRRTEKLAHFASRTKHLGRA